MAVSPPTGPGKQYNALPGVPEYFVQVIGDMERGKLPYIWTLQKNVDGYSLMLKSPAKSAKRIRRHLEPVNKDTLSRKQDHMKSSSCSVPDKVPTRDNTRPKKKKSPSCKQRDRNRRRRWKRKKKSPRALDKSSDSDHGQDLDSLSLIADAIQSVVRERLSPGHDTVQDCLAQANSNQSPFAEDNSPAETTVSEVTSQDDLWPTPPPAISESGDESEYDTYRCDRCAYCSCLATDSAPLRLCTGCYLTNYCSRQCHAAHWKSGHKQYCKQLKEMMRAAIPTDCDDTSW
jgi:hypothetical protein